MEMEPEPSWSNSLKAFCAYSSSFLERYLRSECFTLNICSDYIQTQRAYNMPLVKYATSFNMLALVSIGLVSL